MWELVLKICCLSYYSNSVVFQFLIDSGRDIKLLPRRHTDVSATPLNIAPHLKQTQMKQSHIVLFFFRLMLLCRVSTRIRSNTLMFRKHVFTPRHELQSPTVFLHWLVLLQPQSYWGNGWGHWLYTCAITTLCHYIGSGSIGFLILSPTFFIISLSTMCEWENGTFRFICLWLRLTHACGSLIQAILHSMKKLCKWSKVHTTTRGCKDWIMWLHEDAILKHLHHCSIFYTPPPLQMCFISLLCLITLEQHYQLSEADVLL